MYQFNFTTMIYGLAGVEVASIYIYSLGTKIAWKQFFVFFNKFNLDLLNHAKNIFRGSTKFPDQNSRQIG